MVKVVLYVIVIPIVVYAVDSININAIFKKSKNNYYQARIMYMFIVMGMAYLIVNFVYDFLGVFS